MLVTVEGVGGVWTPELARATFAFGGDGATVPEAFDATGSVTLGGAAFAGTESDGAKMGGMVLALLGVGTGTDGKASCLTPFVSVSGSERESS